jgi:hypothetical protein
MQRPFMVELVSGGQARQQVEVCGRKFKARNTLSDARVPGPPGEGEMAESSRG